MSDTTTLQPAAAYKITNIDQNSSAADLPRFSQYPFLGATIAEIFATQAKPEDLRIRLFQKELIESGLFLITSPRTGEKTPSADSVILPDRTIFYRFQDEPDLLLGSCNLGRGYPIVAIIIRSARLLITLGDPLWGVTAHHASQVEAILAAPDFHAAAPATELRIFTGDSNFAHHIWNQLGALAALCAVDTPPLPLTIKTTFTPLGPIADLFPKLARHKISWIQACISGDENQPGRIHINLGSALVTSEVQKRVRATAIRHASHSTRAEAARLLQRHFPIIWISIRSRNRTAENQAEAITALCARLFAGYPKCALILDGYSTPFDLKTNSNYHASDSDLQIANDLAEAAKIKRALFDAGLPGKHQRITTAIGLPVLDSILLAATASFSFCHHGTVQHKIGWTTATPGVVHGNRRTIRPRPGPWVSAQVEYPPAVTYIPESLVDNIETDQSTDAETASRLFENYRFSDIAALVEFTCQTMKDNIAKTRRSAVISSLTLLATLRLRDLRQTLEFGFPFTKAKPFTKESQK